MAMDTVTTTICDEVHTSFEFVRLTITTEWTRTLSGITALPLEIPHMRGI
jgi:hypothetical protein